MNQIWLASSNVNKLKELKDLCTGRPYEILSPKELGFYSPPDETGDTFKANALIKAKYLKVMVKNEEAWVIAEDSGLVVEGLGGLPGIHSARYAGAKATDLDNTAKLLKMMKIRSPINRNAFYHCSILAISPQGEEFHFEGQFEGTLAKAQKGTGGFGYDPVFIPKGEEQTLGELPSSFKAKYSHRAIAFRKFIDHLSAE